MSSLSTKDQRELRRGGLNVDANPVAYRRVIALTGAQERGLLKDGLTVTEAGALLNITVSKASRDSSSGGCWAAASTVNGACRASSSSRMVSSQASRRC